MKKIICMLLIVSILLCGCAGSESHPIAMYLPGDENKSCVSLKTEILNIDKQIKIKEVKKAEKDFGNIANFICGFIIIIPWFFMDLKGAEQVDIDALLQRKDALLVIATEKNCEF